MERDAIDLGSADVFRLFNKYFIPTLSGMLSMSAVTAVDGIFVGHGVGSDGVAAINICIPVLMLLMGVALMLGAGCSVVASIHLSRGKQRVARMNVTQTLVFGTLAALLPSAGIMCFPERTGLLLGSSSHLLPIVKDYMVWFAPSLLFQMWVSISLFLIRLDGAPKLAMWCNIIPAAINVLLDWLFIFPFGWGISGAAAASALSLFAGGGICIWYMLFHARQLRPAMPKWSRKSLRLSMRNIGYQCRIGSSALLGESTMAMLMFIGNQVFMHYLGDDGVGAFGIACYYAPFVFMVGNAIAQSAQPIISYNFGAGQHSRAAAAERIALSAAVVCGTVVTLMFSCCPEWMVGLLLDPAVPAAQIAIDGFPAFSAAFTFFIINLTAIGYFQSVKRIRPATIFALLRGICFLVPSFLLLPKAFGTTGIWLALALSEISTTLCIGLYYLYCKGTDKA
ncbi:MAG: MATE family efflux transporter [Bacteroidales bacterium]|nr:MATE family efflux transporter [Bacteroidales bacterium]